MPNKKYHIHLICIPDDQVTMLDGMSIFMENRAFLTRDLLQSDEESIEYSRGCINSCDFLILLLGDSYGNLVNTGVSQLHLNYIYARTKSKPMMIMLKLHTSHDNLSRQLIDMIGIVEQEYSKSIYYYDEDIKMQEHIEPAYKKFLEEHDFAKNKTVGWVSKANKRKKLKTTVSKLSNKTILKEELVNDDVIEDVVTEKTVLETIGIETIGIEKAIIADQSHIIEQPLAQSIDADVNADFQVTFSTHAFQDGNLSEMSYKVTLRWLHILHAIDKLSAPMSTNAFQRVVNEMVHSKALQLVQLRHRKVHAVSRTTVITADLQWMQAQLINQGWLIKKKSIRSSVLRSSGDILQLTPHGKLALNSL